MRKANTNDLFNIARLVNELGLKDDIFEAQKNAQKSEADANAIGYELVFSILSKATTKASQDKIYQVLCEPFEMSAEEVGLLEFDQLIENCKNCFNLTTVLNFIKRVDK